MIKNTCYLNLEIWMPMMNNFVYPVARGRFWVWDSGAADGTRDWLRPPSGPRKKTDIASLEMFQYSVRKLSLTWNNVLWWENLQHCDWVKKINRDEYSWRKRFISWWQVMESDGSDQVSPVIPVWWDIKVRTYFWFCLLSSGLDWLRLASITTRQQ